MTTRTTTPATPVWVPFDPADAAPGEFGWLWLDGPVGEEWVLIRIEEDEDEDTLCCDLLGRMDLRGDRDALDAESLTGTPYLPLLQPTVVPGESDALEVAIRFGPGRSTTHAFGQSDRLAAVKDATFSAMSVGRGDDA